MKRTPCALAYLRFLPNTIVSPCRVFLAASGVLFFAHVAMAANTEYDVISGSSEDLTTAATFTVGGFAAGAPPSSTSDITFLSGNVYQDTTTTPFTVNSNLSVGSINDSSSTALYIRNEAVSGTDTLTLNGGDSVSGSSADLLYVATGASLTIGNGSASLGLLIGNSGNLDISGSAAIGSVISGASGATLTKSGTGTLTLTTVNTFTGGFVLAGGNLKISSSGALSTGSFTIGDGTTFDNTTSGVIALSNSAYAINGSFTFTGTHSIDCGSAPVTLGANSTETIGGSSGLFFEGVISDGANTFGITKAGTGVLTLSGANTFKGGVSITAGQLNINNSQALGTGLFTVSGGVTLSNTSASAVVVSNTVNFLGGTVTWAPVVAGSSLELSGSVGLSAATTLTTNIGSGGAPLIISGPVGGGFSITKNGAGTLTLSGSNTFSGGLTFSGNSVSPAQLNLNNNYALGTGTFTFGTSSANETLDNTSGAPVTEGNSNPLVIQGSTITFVGSNSLNLGNGPVTFNASPSFAITAGTLTLGGQISGATFAVSKSGAGTLTFSGTAANTFTTTAISTGTLNFAGSLGSGAITASGGALNELGTGFLSGTSSVALSGGAVTLGGSNSYNGTTSIAANTSGPLTLAATAANTSGGISAAASSNSALTINRLTQIDLRGDADVAFDFASINTVGGGTDTYGIDVGSATGGLVGHTLTLNFNSANLGVVNTASTLNVTGQSGYTLNLGTISLPASATFSTVAGVTLKASTSSTSSSVSTLTYSGSGNFILGGSPASGASTFSTTGTTIVTGTGTYGTTALKAGTLIVSGSLSGTTITVGNSTALGASAILMGNGTVGAVKLGAAAGNTGAELDPGNGPNDTGLLTTGALSGTSGATIGIEIGGTTVGNGNDSTGYDQISSSSIALGSGNFTLNLSIVNNFTATLGDKFFIMLNSGNSATTGTFAGLAQNAQFTVGSDVFQINYADNGDSGSVANDISLTVVPEPDTSAMLLWGLSAFVGIGLIRRRRRSNVRLPATLP